MTPRPAVWAAVLGVACGFAGGVAGARLEGRDAGRGRGAAGTVRGDLDRLEAATLDARAETSARLTELAARLPARDAAGGASDPLSAADVCAAETGAALRGLSEDLRRLRDAFAGDLRRADLRIAELERHVEQLTAAVLSSPPQSPRPPTDEDEAAWLNLARDADPGRRFSALTMLGRARTDRSVRASAEALHDAAAGVVWQAARNLGEFGDRSAARDLAALLRHDDVSVRHASHEALRKLGAPDTKYVASDLPEERHAATEALERWAAEAQ